MLWRVLDKLQLAPIIDWWHTYTCALPQLPQHQLPSAGTLEQRQRCRMQGQVDLDRHYHCKFNQISWIATGSTRMCVYWHPYQEHQSQRPPLVCDGKRQPRQQSLGRQRFCFTARCTVSLGMCISRMRKPALHWMLPMQKHKSHTFESNEGGDNKLWSQWMALALGAVNLVR